MKILYAFLDVDNYSYQQQGNKYHSPTNTNVAEIGGQLIVANLLIRYRCVAIVENLCRRDSPGPALLSER